MNSNGFPFGGAAQRIPQAYSAVQTQNQPNDKLRRRQVRLELTDEQKAEIREAFEIFDMDKDGALDFHEFKVMHPFDCFLI